VGSSAAIITCKFNGWAWGRKEIEFKRTEGYPPPPLYVQVFIMREFHWALCVSTHSRRPARNVSSFSLRKCLQTLADKERKEGTLKMTIA
jgi:hypothetical protein